MVLSCLGLLYMQMDYITAIVRMRREHFGEGVRRSLHQTAYNLELNEMRYYLSKNIQRDIPNILQGHNALPYILQDTFYLGKKGNVTYQKEGQ